MPKSATAGSCCQLGGTAPPRRERSRTGRMAGIAASRCQLEAVHWPGFVMATTQIATAVETATVVAVAATATATACFTNGFHVHVQCVMFLGKDCSAWLVMAMSGLKYNNNNNKKARRKHETFKCTNAAQEACNLASAYLVAATSCGSHQSESNRSCHRGAPPASTLVVSSAAGQLSKS